MKASQKIIDEARKRLPLPSEYQHERIRIPFLPDTINLIDKNDMEVGQSEITTGEIEFRKQVINGIIVGWELI